MELQTTQQKNKALVSRLFEVMVQGNLTELTAMLTDDFVWSIPGNIDYFALAGEKDKAFFPGFFIQFTGKFSRWHEPARIVVGCRRG